MLALRPDWILPPAVTIDFPYSLKVPFLLGASTARVVFEQTSGEGCFDKRPKL